MVEKYTHKSGQLSDNIKSQDTQAQLAWLDSELAASRAPVKLVFGHHTMFSGGSGHGDTPEVIAEVLPILKRHGVRAYINGHDHDLQHIRRECIDIIATGAGSEVRPVQAVEGTQFCAAQSGFTILTLTPTAVNLEFRNYLGQSLYKATI
ncbi:MAG: metallophosphoesterase [Asticcacaulis sp.]